MARPKHRIHAAGAYFVNSETWQRRAVFRNETAARLVVEAMLHYRKEGAYKLHEFVVMHDHIHLILTPSEEVSLEKAMQLIKGGSSRRIGQELVIRFPVWQAGFREHLVRSQEDFERCRRYIHGNPVRARLCEHASAYPFSSASELYELNEFMVTSGAEAPITQS